MSQIIFNKKFRNIFVFLSMLVAMSACGLDELRAEIGKISSRAKTCLDAFKKDIPESKEVCIEKCEEMKCGTAIASCEEICLTLEDEGLFELGQIGDLKDILNEESSEELKEEIKQKLEESGGETDIDLDELDLDELGIDEEDISTS